MKRAWKRSVAATVLVVALGSANSPGGQQPERPKSEGPTPGVTPAAARTGGTPRQGERSKLELEAAKLHSDYTTVAEELNRINKVLEDRNQELQGKSDKEVEQLQAQIRDLEAQAKKLEDDRARLAAQLKQLTQQQAKAEKQAPRIKVFRLKHRDPNEVSSVLTDLLPQQHPAGGAGMMMGMQGQMGSGMIGGGPMGGMMGTPNSGGGSGMMPGMGHGMGLMGFSGGAAGFGGGLGGFAGGSGGVMARPNTSWRIAVDERTNTLVVRGSESDLRTIGEIVAAIDVADNKTATKLKNLRTFKLKHADVNQVSQIVQDLELSVRVSILPSSEMLVITGGENALKEVADLIDELDVEGKPTKEIKKPKQ